MDTSPQTPQVLDETQMSEHLRERLERVEELHRQLGMARAEFRREKQKFRDDTVERERRADTVLREATAIHGTNASEKARLIRLRKRLIVRWKDHWSTQRLGIDTERAELLQGYDDLAREKIEFIAERRKITDAIATEKQGFIARRDEFAEEVLRERKSLDTLTRQLEQRRGKLDGETSQLAAREKELRRQEKLAVRLREEAVGLEERISRHRKLLDQMESARSQTFASIPLRGPMSPVALMLHAPDESEVSPEVLRRDTRRLSLVEAELDDQRTTLGETAVLLDGVQTKIHDEQEQLADELLALARELGDREAELEQRERRQARDDRRISDDRQGMMRDRVQIEALRAKQIVGESTLVGERERLRIEIEARLGRIGEHRQQLAEIAMSWLTQRRDEAERLRGRLRELGQLGQKWSEYIQGDAARLTAQQEREQRLLEREAAVQSVQLEILAEIESPMVLERKLERQRRRIVQQYGRRAEQLADLRDKLGSEMLILRQLMHELPSAIPTAELTMPDLPTLRVVAETKEVPPMIASYQKQLAVLRDELDRLANLPVTVAEPIAEERRAA